MQIFICLKCLSHILIKGIWNVFVLNLNHRFQSKLNVGMYVHTAALPFAFQPHTFNCTNGTPLSRESILPHKRGGPKLASQHPYKPDDPSSRTSGEVQSYHPPSCLSRMIQSTLACRIGGLRFVRGFCLLWDPNIIWKFLNLIWKFRKNIVKTHLKH